jgi:uncharacterized protein (TIGR01244 family)
MTDEASRAGSVRVPTLRGVLGACATLVVVAVVAIGGLAGLLAARGNLHAVLPGELYRSATLTPDQLKSVIAEAGIRTIINLRGGAEDAWHRDEAATAAASGVRLVDFSWSADRELTDAQVSRFLAAVETAERPILIHCRSGADRTGLASALYLAVVKHADEASAEAQLSIRFGHVGLPYLSGAYAMDETFERLEPTIGYTGS